MTCKKWHTILLVLLVLTLPACSKNKTKLVATLNDPSFNGPAMQQVLVIGVMNNGLNRHVYEDTFVDALKANGVDAIASHTLLPQFEDFGNKDKFMGIIGQSGAGHVLLAVLMDTKKYDGTHTGENLDNHFQYSYRNLRRPQYQSQKKTIHLETSIYQASNKNRIWAGSTKSYDPDSVQVILDGNTRIIMAELKKVGLLP